MLIVNLNVVAKDIQILGEAVKLFDGGKRVRYFNTHGEIISIHMPKKNNKLITKGTIYGKGGFKFKKNIPRKYIGEEFQIKTNKNWFILSPFNGKFFLPKYSTRMNIVMIPKSSQIFQELFKVRNYYSIQTLVTRSSVNAESQLNNLQNFCIRNSTKSSYYCKKYVKKSSIIEPGRDPLYKIYYEQYKFYKDAKKDLKKIRKLRDLDKSFIVQYTTINTDF